MCGIAGIVLRDRVDQADILRMLDVIRHRGPDDHGIHEHKNTLFGQARLSIIDLEGGHQPIFNEDRSMWIVANGEIYNFQEIRQELIAKGHQFSTKSDSEVILHLYEEIGERCVERLNGMFAFAIWDSRKEQLFAARDRLGQKPFYYTTNGDRFAFCSEIKGLLAYDPSLRELNHQGLDQYFTLRIIAPPQSMFKGVDKLPPAHTLTYSIKDGVTIKRYWQLEYDPKWTGDENQLVDELEEILIRSLRRHMVSDVPVGAFLSGGLDSTLVVSMLMKHVVSEPLKTFSFGLPYGNYDEAPYARMVAEKYGTEHYEKIVTPSLVQTLPDLLWHLDEPSDPLSVCTYLISDFARKHVKVVLGGDGGDELFGGYDRYYGNVYAGYYAKVPSIIRNGIIGPMLNLMPDGKWYKSKFHQMKWLQKLASVEGGYRYAESLSYFYFNSDRKQSLYTPEMKRQLANYDATSAIREPFDHAHANNVIDKMLNSDNSIRLPDHPVMITDRMTMAASLEARSPFMDHEVAEFTARLPVEYKVKGRRLRYIQYRLAERYLPDEVLNRPKQGFSSALPYMLKDEYKKLFEMFLKSPGLVKEGILNQSAIDLLLRQHLNNERDNGNRLWLILNAEVWYQMHIQNKSVSDIRDILDQ